MPKPTKEAAWLAIVLAIIAASGAWATSWFHFKSQQALVTAELVAAKLEITDQRDALGFDTAVREWEEVEEAIDKLLEETEISRFLILRAWNGKHEPKWATATHQIREVGQKRFTYIHIDLDADYVDRLRSIMRNRYMIWATEGMPESLIKDIYRAEGVKCSLWAMVSTRINPRTGSALHTYCSAASTTGPISPETATRVSLVVSRVKAYAALYGANPSPSNP